MVTKNNKKEFIPSTSIKSILDKNYPAIIINSSLDKWWDSFMDYIIKKSIYYPKGIDTSRSLMYNCRRYSKNHNIRFIGTDTANKCVIYLSDERFYKYSNYGTMSKFDMFLEDIDKSIPKNPLYTRYTNLVYRTKIGKFIGKMFNFSGLSKLKENKFIEECTLHFNQHFVNIKDINIQILPPDKIAWAYDYHNYNTGGGQLNASCMRHENSQEKMDFYAENGLSIVVLLEENKVSGRALLWDNLRSCGSVTKNPKPIFMLDRVYAISEYTYKLFDKFAKQNNFITRNGVNNNSLTLYRKIIVPKTLKYFPYLDTMFYLYPQAGLISNKILPTELCKRSSKVELKCTTGYFEEANPNIVKDPILCTLHNIKECKWIDKYKGYVHERNIVKIRKGMWHINDPKIVRLINYEYELKGKCVATKVGTWLRRGDAIKVYTPVLDMEDSVYLGNKEYVSKLNKSYGITLEGYYVIKNKYIVERNGVCYAFNDPCLTHSEVSKKQLYFGNKGVLYTEYDKWYTERPFDKMPEYGGLEIKS